jgi:anti-sigma-K factor RskA
LNPNDYIATGKLELYVLGQLEPAEEREVEQLARDYPEIRAEIDAIEHALEQYAQRHAIPPPDGTLEPVLDRIRQSSASPPPAAATPRSSRRSFAPLWAALFVLAGVAAVWFWNQQRDTETQLVNLELEYANLSESCAEQAEIMDIMSEQIDFLRAPGSRQVILNSANEELAPGAIATVFYNDRTRQSFFAPSALPPVPTGRQYQLWAIVDGAADPVDMGVLTFDPEVHTLIEVPFIDNPVAFAITLEPAGGSAKPTLDQMYVIGNVS